MKKDMIPIVDAAGRLWNVSVRHIICIEPPDKNERKIRLTDGWIIVSITEANSVEAAINWNRNSQP